MDPEGAVRPASRIRSPSLPPAASQESANECRNWWGWRPGEADVGGAVGDDLEQPRGRHRAAGADPQVRQMGEGVAGTQAKVAVQRQGGLATKRHGALAAALAEDDHDLVVQVVVVAEQDAGGFGDANPGCR